MPTSVRGNLDPVIRSRGFTLIELLVVLALVALATASVSLAMRSSDRDQLEREAERLATLLDAARAEARTQSVAATWRVLPSNGEGPQFQFEGLPSRTALPNRWLGEEAPTVTLEPSVKAVALGPEPLIPAQTLRLRLNDAELRLSTDGLGPFAIQREAPAP